MRIPSKLHVILFGVILLICAPCAAQVSPPQVSTAALSYGKFADLPISNVTGTGNVSVPIHTITDGPLSLPVSLQYHTGGLRVQSPASDVGLGWNLSAGGMISRTVLGMPDDDSDGYFHRGDEVTIPTTQNDPSWSLDSEPDIFTYSVMGLNGKFFFDSDGKAKQVPLSDLRIKPYLVSGKFEGFEITLTDGTRCYFGNNQGTTGTLNSAIDASRSINGDGDLVSTTSGWHLVAIVSADGNHWIKLDYVENDYHYLTPGICAEEYKYRNDQGNIRDATQCSTPYLGIHSPITVESVILETISTESNFQTITCVHGARNDLYKGRYGVMGTSIYTVDQYAKRIESIDVQDGNVCTSTKFTYGYFKDDQVGDFESDKQLLNGFPLYKLKLESVHLEDCSGSLEMPAYEFTYEGHITSSGEQFAPATFNTNIDHWGFYNYDGLNANHEHGPGALTPQGTSAQVGGVDTYYGHANRETNETAVKIGSLTKIRYPTGGTLDLNYEANRRHYASETLSALNAHHSGPTRVESNYPSSSGYSSFDYTSALDNACNVRWEVCIQKHPEPDPHQELPEDSEGYQGIGAITIFTGEGQNTTDISSAGFNVYSNVKECLAFEIKLDQNNNSPIIGIPKIGQTGVLQLGQDYGVRVTAANATVTFRILYDAVPVEKLCGGLRIAETTTHDGIDASRDIVKSYNYRLSKFPDVTSGHLFREPQYSYNINLRTALFTAYSMASLSSFEGYHVAYERVTVDHHGIGEQEFLFNIDVDETDVLEFPYAPHRFKVDNATPLASYTYDESGALVTESATQRRNNDYNSSGIGIVYAKRLGVPHYGQSLEHRHKQNQYFIHTNVYRPETVSTMVDGISSEVSYEYNHTEILSPSATESINSNGDIFRSETDYSIHYPTASVQEELEDLNMVGLLYESRSFFNGDQVDGQQIDYRFYSASGLSPSTSTSSRVPVPRIYLKRRYQRTWNSAGVLQGGGWVDKIFYDKYTGNGLPREYHTLFQSPTNVTYNNKRLTTKTFAGHTVAYDYGTADGTRVVQKTAVDGTTTSFTYDDLGRLATVTDDCKNIMTSYDYRPRYHSLNVNLVETITDYTGAAESSVMTQTYSRQFTDGLGRNIVNIAKQMGPNSGENIVTGQDFDQYGRVTRSYSPYVTANPWGSYSPNDPAREHTSHLYQDNPLGRKIAVTPPGWSTTSYDYGTNSIDDTVLKDGSTTETYPEGALQKQIVIDGNGNQAIVFTDLRGSKVLSRRTSAADNPTDRLDTYFLHDGKGRLTTVLPPGADLSDERLIYSYVYTSEDQIQSKVVPGKAREFYRYNELNELVARRDGNLSAQNMWYVYRYDNLSRIINEGLYDGPLSVNTLNPFPDEKLVEHIYGTNYWDKDKLKKVRTKVLDGNSTWLETENFWSPCGLLDQQKGNSHLVPSMSSPEITDYRYDGASNILESTYDHNKPSGGTLRIKAEYGYDHAGRNTEEWFQVGAGDRHQLFLNEFNERGQSLVQYQGKNLDSGNSSWLQKIDFHYLDNGMLKGLNLDGLTGTTVSLPEHGATAVPVNPGVPAIGSDLDAYDLLYLQLYRAQRVSKAPPANPGQGGGGGGGAGGGMPPPPGAQNPPTKPGSISNEKTNEQHYVAPARYNGDINSVATQVRGRTQQIWGMNYDNYDRMTRASFWQRPSATADAELYSGYFEEVGYDQSGNITTLNRKLTYVAGQTYYTDLIADYLTYDYPDISMEKTNRLGNITDDGSARGYTPNNGSYGYDANGNMTDDPAKGITVEYNHLDLPTSVEWTANNQRIEMIYDAIGTLLRRTSYSTGTTIHEQRDYVGGIEYVGVNHSLESVAHSQGRVHFDGNTERYDFALADHLGNTRLLYADLNKDGKIAVPTEIIQEAHYLPFGMKMVGPWMGGSKNDDSAYEYNGIEYVDEFDLGVNMAMYRTLDPVIGRWWSVDPKAEMTMGWTPYNAMGNSPMVHTDPNGDVLPAVLVGALIGAGVSGTTTIATNAVAGNNLFQGFGKAVAFGAVGGAIGAGFNGMFTTAFGQSAGTSILSNVASTAATSVAFGQDITLGTLAGSVAGGLLGGVLPQYTGVRGGALANIGAEIGIKSALGAVNGAVTGGVRSLVDRGNIGEGIVSGAKYGAIGGAVQAGLNIATMGASFLPKYHGKRGYNVLSGRDRPTYRRGTFITKALAGTGSGVALGRNLVVHQYLGRTGGPHANQKLRLHEYKHFLQQRKLGFGKFYGRTASEYSRYGLGNVYSTYGTLEYNADRYVRNMYR